MIGLLEEKIAQLLQDFYLTLGGWMRYQYKHMDQDLCLTLPQFQVLYTIMSFEECTMSCLSDSIEVSKGTMTNMLNKLVEEGYVKRSSSTIDRRNVYVSLTPKGQEKVMAIKKKILFALTNALSRLKEEDLGEIKEGLEVLTTVFKVKE